MLGEVEASGLRVPHHQALDFGCGVGRLTQALAEHFERVAGVDIAASMIARARQENRHGDRVRYVVNERSDLAGLGSAAGAAPRLVDGAGRGCCVPSWVAVRWSPDWPLAGRPCVARA